MTLRRFPLRLFVLGLCLLGGLPAAHARRKKPAPSPAPHRTEIPELPEAAQAVETPADPTAPADPEAEALQELQAESEGREKGGFDGTPPPRLKSLRRAYFAAGPVLMGHLNTSGPGFGFAGAYGWDTARVLTKLQVQFAFNGLAYAADVTLMGNYFYDLSLIHPYIETDFGIGMSKPDGGGAVDGSTVGGPVLGAGVGFQIRRFHTVTFDLGVRMGVLFFPNPLGLPLTYAARLGMYF